MSLNHIFNRSKAKAEPSEIYSQEFHTFNGLTFDQDLISDGRLYVQYVNNRNYLLFRQENGHPSVLNSALQRVYLNLESTTINHNDPETSIVSYSNYIGTPLVRLANTTRVGRTNLFESGGKITVTSSGKQIRIRIKLGTILIKETIITLPNLSVGSEFRFHNKSIVLATGQAGVAAIRNQGSFSIDDKQGNSQIYYFNTTNNTTFETVTTQSVDVTCEWVTSSVGDTITFEDLEYYILT